jgi:predicted house-cleaning noncanonical NTP pyrophosphatase (MazG superfamily)
MTRYDKLVRDKIPEIIHSRNEECIFHVAGDEEYFAKLKEKLIEEAEEFIKDDSENELIDLMEVLNAIIEFKGLDKTSLELLRFQKEQERGGFKNKIILEQS